MLEAMATTRRRLSQDSRWQTVLQRVLLLLSIAAGIGYLPAIVGASEPVRAVIKILSIAPLVLLPLLVAPARLGLSLALLASLLGDISLVFPGKVWFLRGLLAFLAAHIVYVYLFSKQTRKPLRLTAAEILGCAFLVSGAISALAFLWPWLGVMQLPVLIYASALTGMNIAALLTRMPGVFFGALLFLISDTLLGLRIFGGLPGWSSFFIWATYYAAQLSITCGYLGAAPTRSEAPGELRDSTGSAPPK